MQLNINGIIATEDTQSIDIIDALDRLSEDADSFAILSQNDMTYLQTSGDSESGFILEYQEGSTADHYGCYDNLSLDTVQAVFLSYFNGDDRWRREVGWENSGL